MDCMDHMTYMANKTLADTSHGPDRVVPIVFVLFLILSVMLLTGHGGWFIAGYNTASKEEQEKYDRKKLCRCTGVYMSVITLLLFIMMVFEERLPASFAGVVCGITIVGAVILGILCNTICRK